MVEVTLESAQGFHQAICSMLDGPVWRASLLKIGDAQSTRVAAPDIEGGRTIVRCIAHDDTGDYWDLRLVLDSPPTYDPLANFH